MKESRLIIRSAKEESRLEIRKRQNAEQPAIAVTPAGYDQIDQVLSTLGYHYTTIDDRKLADFHFISRFKVLFLNCSDKCLEHSNAAGSALREYVIHGGSIYASDFAADYVYQAFPKAFAYRGDGREGKLQARVVDRGLAQSLTDRITLTFDMPYWRMVTYLSAGHHKYLVDDSGRPLLASFRHGQGQVVFTSFHNHAQPSQAERTLLEFLVLKPLTASASVQLEKVPEQHRVHLQETPARARVSQGDVRTYHNPTEQDLSFSITWTGSARFRLRVTRPSGDVFAEHETTISPCVIRVPQAVPGVWTYTVLPLQVPYQGFPYVALAGPEQFTALALPSANK